MPRYLGNVSTGTSTRRRILQTTAGLGVFSIIGTSTTGGQTTGDKIWKFEADDFVVSSPTVVGGTVYVGSNDGTVYALDAATGELRWSFTGPENRVRSSPAVVNGTVYIGCDDGVLYAIEAETGEKEWVVDIGIQNLASPTVDTGTVYVGGGGDLYALDAENGNELWTFDAGMRSSTSPIVADGIVYTGSSVHPTNAPGVYALDGETGEEVWASEALDGDARIAPTIDDGTLYVGAGLDETRDTTLYAIDAQTGETNWTFETQGIPSVAPTVANETVYIGTSEEYEELEFRGTLHAVDTETGDEKWAFQDPGTNIASSPTVSGETVYFGSSGLYAINADDGTAQWQFGDPAVGRSSPTIVDGVVYFGLDDSTVYAVETGDSASSGDSRINLGALGHHHIWAKQAGDETSQEGGELVGEISVTEDLLAEPTASSATVRIAVESDTQPTVQSTEIQVDTATETDSVSYTLSDIPAGEYRIIADVVAIDGDTEHVGGVTIMADAGPYDSIVIEHSETYSGFDFTLAKAGSDGDTPTAEYADEEGIIRTDGLLNAAADFRDGEINTNELLDVAAAFRSGEPVA